MAGLADVLVEQGVLTPEQVDQANEHAQTSGSFAKSVVVLGLAGEDDLVRAVAGRLGMEFVDLAPGTVDPTAAMLMTKAEANALQALGQLA